jgi:hypothetical protein
MTTGVHTIEDSFFGTVTVTVIPEPSGMVLAAAGGLPLLRRRRIS